MQQAPAELAPKEAVRALEAFVIDNPELADLEAVVGRFNVFDALRVVRAELAHSNFLAWLIDPSESHGLGQLFLRAVLMDILRETDANLRPMSPIDLDGLDMGGVEVRREWRSIDLLIVSAEPKVVVAIENKVDSAEHSDQLTRYRDTVRAAFPEHKPMFVFLTREGDEPSHGDWTPYDYGRLHDAIQRAVTANEAVIGDDVRTFLAHYLHTIRSHFMNDEEIDRLCETIYAKHRVALDLIFERRADSRHDFVGAVRDWLMSRYGDGFVGERSQVGLVFVPPAWMAMLPPVGLKPSDHAQAWVQGRIYVPRGRKRVRFQVRIGPTSDQEIRDELIAHFAKTGSKAGVLLSRKRVGEKFATCFSEDLINASIPMDADDETIERLTRRLPRIVERIDQITPLLEAFFETGEDSA